MNTRVVVSFAIIVPPAKIGAIVEAQNIVSNLPGSRPFEHRGVRNPEVRYQVYLMSIFISHEGNEASKFIHARCQM
jgi:hypothetical protein